MRGNGRYPVAAFGASGKDADEPNAAQWWSAVSLAIPEAWKTEAKCEE